MSAQQPGPWLPDTSLNRMAINTLFRLHLQDLLTCEHKCLRCCEHRCALLAKTRYEPYKLVKCWFEPVLHSRRL